MSPDLLLHPAVQSGLLPLFVAIAAAAVLHLVARPLAQIAIAAGFLAAFGVTFGWPAWPPVGSNQKIAVLAFALFALGLVLDAVAAARPIRLPAALAAFVAGLVWLAWPQLGSGQGLTVTAVLGAAGLVALVLLWRARDDGVAAAVMLLVAAVGLGTIALLGGSASILQSAMALAAAVGGFLLWNWPRQRHPLGATVLMAGVLLTLLAAQMALYTRASPMALGLMPATVLAAPAAPWLRVPSAALRPVIVGALAALPVAAALLAAWLHGSGDVYTG